ncbi:MAG: hypothetical protein KatS3mg131_2609 [Candidatus Tectimicrobiota bacterium]|nr:MAG: hypothetical protein KatS3mg131_2609 [Candidatus Tectomicrobia bacterium]
MNEEAKKTALRMIPYGLYVLTAEGASGAVAAATVNWVTQASFSPPLVVVGVKADSGAHALIRGKRQVCPQRAWAKGSRAWPLTFSSRTSGRTTPSAASPSSTAPPAFPFCSTPRALDRVPGRGDRGARRPHHFRGRGHRSRGAPAPAGARRRSHPLAQRPGRKGVLRRLAALGLACRGRADPEGAASGSSLTQRRPAAAPKPLLPAGRGLLA